MSIKKKKTSARVFALLGVITAAMIIYPVVFARPVRAAQDTARLNIIAGEVQAKPKGSNKWTPVKDGATLNEGDSVKTLENAKAEIVFFEGSITRLGSKTEITIEKTGQVGDSQNSRDISLKVILGQTWHRVKKMFSSESRYEVKTATAVATARGTEFRVDVDATGKSICYVVDGSVGVTSMDGKVVVLENGDKIIVSLGASVTDEMIQKIIAGDIDDFYLWNMETSDSGNGLLNLGGSTPDNPPTGTTTAPVDGFTVSFTVPIDGETINYNPTGFIAVSSDPSITSASFIVNGSTVGATIIAGGKFHTAGVYLKIGTNTITATAKNTLGETASDTIYVTETIGTMLYVELNNGGHGLYSHLVAPGGTYGDIPGDCNSSNPNPDWGPVGADGNPKLDGIVPNIEYITVIEPASGVYGFYVQDDTDTADVSATVKVYLNAILLATYNNVLNNADVWYVCDVSLPEGAVTEVGTISGGAFVGEVTPVFEETAPVQEDTNAETIETPEVVPENAAGIVPNDVVTPV
jgi:uncharacterized cupin superfamily protein